MLYPRGAAYSPRCDMGSSGLWWWWYGEYDCPYSDMAPSVRGNVKPGCKAPAAVAAAAAAATAAADLASLAILSFSSSASWSRLAFALRFWNQIFTWVSVRVREEENSARSAMDRYCFCLNFLSRARSWDVVNGVRGFLLVLCFLSWQPGLTGPVGRGYEGLSDIRYTQTLFLCQFSFWGTLWWFLTQFVKKKQINN